MTDRLQDGEREADVCGVTMRGFYDAVTRCARPRGHRWPHDQVWRASDWEPTHLAASTTDDSESRLQELELLNARLVVERDAAERALREIAEGKPVTIAGRTYLRPGQERAIAYFESATNDGGGL